MYFVNNKMVAVSLTVLFLQVFIPSLLGTERYIVQTNVGEIAGTLTQTTLPDGTQTSLVEFLGIPYAESPIGSLRFAKPVPRNNFQSLFNASDFGPACPQILAEGSLMSEDCLTLNIFVPFALLNSTAMPGNMQNWSTETVRELVAVMVWIHGGAFVSGQGRDMDVQTLVALGKIVIVTINYRLGPLGFLTTDDLEAPGNYGLWDQRLALMWVNSNILSFGGDPQSVTVVGGSAGGDCVTYQALYEENRGLLRRIIAASGTALSVSAYHNQGLVYAKQLAEKLQCPRDNSRDLVRCLRGKNVTDLIQTQVDSRGTFDLPWVPVVDRDFIKTPPSRILTWPPSSESPDLLKSLDAMFVTTSAEGSVSVGIWLREVAEKLNQTLDNGISKEIYDISVEGVMTNDGETVDQLVKDAIEYEYTNWEKPLDDAATGQSVTDLLTDRHFFIPNVIFARNHALNNSRSKTFLFEFDRGRNDSWAGFPWMSGALHCQYNLFIQGLPERMLGRPLNMSTVEDLQLWNLSKEIISYWSNFAKSGNPNHPEALTNHWEPFTIDDESYLLIDDDAIISKYRCKARRTQLWLELIPEIQRSLIGHQGSLQQERFTSRSTTVKPQIWMIFAFILIFVVWVYFLSYASGDGGPGESIGCMLGNDSTCLQHQCCVKQVITFKDPDKETIVRTKCLAFLKEGEMCLRTPEGYLCDCHPSLRCALSSHATFGYCRRAPSN